MPASGFTLFLTGLPGAGKSTVAAALQKHLERECGRSSTILDGDVVREMLSSGLTFTRADRELNVRRIGYVATEVTRHGGICICAVIAPYRGAREDARERVRRVGHFYEIHMSTPPQVCEARDPKGLYRRARRGEIKGFTGVDDPYEAPLSPQASIDTSRLTVDEAVHCILRLPRLDGLL
ncbi:MAG: adenylyl-sulfate kinase [Pseudomonadota bacterium]|jgi:sulfate adenylyltransferase|nr:adenylyl-sulfate kinase [Pseudomonadota bacterium]